MTAREDIFERFHAIVADYQARVTATPAGLANRVHRELEALEGVTSVKAFMVDRGAQVGVSFDVLLQDGELVQLGARVPKAGSSRR